MIYVETAVAAEIFGIHPRALANSINRGSAKYPFIKISDAGTRSRGGARLLFAVEIADIDAAIKSGKADKDVSVYVEDSSEQSGFRQMKFSEIKGGGKNKEGASKKENFGGEYAVLDDSEKDEINKKIRVLKEYEEAKKRGVSCKKFCEDSGISEANLFRWQKAYKEKGAAALIDKRGKHRKNASVLEEWMIEFLLQNFRAYGAGGVNIAELNRRLHQEYFKRIGEVYNYPKYLMGEIKPLFSDGVIKRFLDSYYQTHKLEYIMVTKGEDKAKSYFQPALGNQGEMITRRNQCWQIDSSPLDMMVRDGEKGEAMRANILSIVDVYSGRCVASIEKKSNALGLIRLMWKALNTLGKPDYIKGDNGKDYLSDQFQHLLNGLHIDYDRAIAYSGDEKGFVERHFGVMQHAGISQTPGYIGFNLAMREAVEQRTPKKDRHAKDENGLPKKTNLKYLLTLDQAKARFETEVAKWDIMKIGRKRPSPMERWNSDDTPLKGVRKEEFMLHAGGLESRVVSKKGINYDAREFGSALLPPVRTPVLVGENIDDVSSIFVFDMDGNFICEAKDKDIHPMSAETYKMVKKVFKDDMRAIRTFIKQAEFSEFTRMNVNYDLEVMLEAYKNALKPENFNYEGDDKVEALKETIKRQKEVNNIINAGFDYDKLNEFTAERTTKKKFSVDDAIEIASGE